MQRTVIAIALAVATSLGHAAALPPTDDNASSSLQYAKALRAEAEPLSGPEAQPADVQRAVVLYQQALDYLATPAAREQAFGNKSLIAEQVNLEYSQALAHAKLGNKQAARSSTGAAAATSTSMRKNRCSTVPWRCSPARARCLPPRISPPCSGS